MIMTSFLKKTKLKKIIFEEQYKDIFIKMLNSTKLKNAQQMYDSRALKWSKNKITKIYEYMNTKN